MEWLRLYSEARKDKKLGSLPDDQFRVWFNLLCFANENNDRGIIRCDDMELLAIEVANNDVSLLETTLERLQKLHIISIDNNEITFINFLKRNYDKPSDMPDATRERQQHSRENKKQKNDVTPCHAQSRAYTDNTNTNTNTNTKKKEKRAREKFDLEKAVKDDSDLPSEVQSALLDFAQMRANMKKPVQTERAFKLLLTELRGLAADEAEQIAIINQSIMKSWLSFFPLKNTTRGAPPGPVKPEFNEYDEFCRTQGIRAGKIKVK